MKMRLSFVTNSSSSSFIIAFASMPKTIEDVYKQLFPNGDESVLDNQFSAMEIATQLFKDLTPQQPQTLKSLKNKFNHMTDEHAPIYPWSSEFKYNSPEYNACIKKYANKMKNYTNATLTKFFNSNKNGVIFVFEYGNDTSNHTAIKSTMEIEEIYQNLQFIKISHH